MLSGVATPALDFITDYFPQLKELLIHFDFDFDQIEKRLKLKFFKPSISLLRQRGVDVLVQPKAKSDFQIETFSKFSSFM